MQSSTLQEPIIHVQKSYRNTVPIQVLDRHGFESTEEFRQRIDDILDEFRDILDKAKQHQLGYPISHLDEIFSPLEGIKNYYINNVGSPDISTAFASNSHSFEMGVLHWFADLWGIEKTCQWSYITNGGTESNIQAIYFARESFPDAVAYVSTDAHFSVFKACHLLRIDVELVDSDDKGEIQYSHLHHLLKKNHGRPAIVVLTCGTTMKGAIDQPLKAIDALHQAGYKDDDDYFIHVDAALSGIFLPLFEDEGAPKMTFDIPGVSSIACSGHKFLGVPIPCGIMMIRKKYIEEIGNSIEYIASKDLTLTCSRNGHATMYLWLMLTELGKDRIKEDALRCIKRAENVQEKIHSAGIDCWVNPFSITVVMEQLENTDLTSAWQLACQGNICHIVVMPHIREETLDTFIDSVISQKPHAVAREDVEALRIPQRESCYYNPVTFAEGDGSSTTL